MLQMRALTDSAVLSVLGERVKQERLNQNITQKKLCSLAGLSLIVIQRLEGGRGCSLLNFLKILRSLGKLDQIDLLLPEPGISPIDLARRDGMQRKEASGRRGCRKQRTK